MASLKTAAKKLEELGYDPVEALVDIARNRNNLGDLRVKAAIALLPYAYAPVPTTSKIEVTEGTGVMKTPGTVSEEAWSAAVATIGLAAQASKVKPDAALPVELPATKH